MCIELPLIIDFGIVEKTLGAVICKLRSLDQIEEWLKSQQCVKSVQLADYILKSNPPQRDFIVEFLMQDGSTIMKIINVFDLGNQEYRFSRLRDQ